MSREASAEGDLDGAEQATGGAQPKSFRRAVEVLNVIDLQGAQSDDELAVIMEHNAAIVPLRSVEESRIAKTVGVLSWRYDVTLRPSAEEMRGITSDKVRKFIGLARAAGMGFAWVSFCCVPYYAFDDQERRSKTVTEHAQLSLRLYECCRVFVVDMEPIYPGLALPTYEYHTRFWVTVEHAMTLDNPEVPASTYVHVDRVNHMTVVLALMGPWTTERGSLQAYDKYLTRAKERRWENWSQLSDPPGENLKEDTSGKRRTDTTLSSNSKVDPDKAGALNAILSGFGRAYLSRHYVGLADFLKQLDSCQLLDRRHLNEPPPIDEREQEELLAMYWAFTPGDERPLDLKPPNQRSNHHVEDLLAAIDEVRSGRRQMEHFSVYEHYEALLILASQVLHWYLTSEHYDMKPQVGPGAGPPGASLV